MCHALPQANDGAKAITAQIKKLKSRKEQWLGKIMTTWRERKIPLFTQEAIHKLIQANSSWVDEVNENRKRQRETIKTDINRHKKILDDIQQKRLSQEDTYQTLLLTTRADMSWYHPSDAERAHIERKLSASTDAYNFSQGRLCSMKCKLESNCVT